MEYYANKVLANVCTPNGGNCTWDSVVQSPESLGTGWSNQFHVWAMEWDAQHIALFLDEKLVNSYAVSDRKRDRPQPVCQQEILCPGQPGAGRQQRRRPREHDVPHQLRSRLRPGLSEGELG